MIRQIGCFSVSGVRFAFDDAGLMGAIGLRLILGEGRSDLGKEGRWKLKSHLLKLFFLQMESKHISS